ncbi:MAG: DNRLRE domain-containing protein [Promethearchaeota archaeon]|nr:MAG: DNRLRE domain-containing protein [Candidatus Lokiarchaeota archaeon]
MKKLRNINGKGTILLIIILLISTCLLIINFIPIFVVNAPGITTEFTGDLYSDRTAYVNQSNPDMNYFDLLYQKLFIGNSCETFIHFNLGILPKETERLYFTLYSSEDVEINVILVDSYWNSSEITWNNKPNHEEIINTVNTSDIMQEGNPEYYNLEKTIDLTEIFKDNQLNEISFCINVTKNNIELDGTARLVAIKLLWNYEKLLLSYTTIISSVIIFSILIGTIIYLRKDIFSCPECDTKRKITERYCSSCGTSFEKKDIVKGSEYQLLLILIWVLVFFELFFIFFNNPYFYYWGIYFMPLQFYIIWMLCLFLCIIQILRKIKKFLKLRKY